MADCLTPDELERKADEYTDTLAKSGITSFPDQIRYFHDNDLLNKLAALAPYIKDAYNKLGLESADAVSKFNIGEHIRTLNEMKSKDSAIKPNAPAEQSVSKEVATKFIAPMLEKAFPNIGVDYHTGEEFKSKFGTDAHGAIDSETGRPAINLDNVTASTQVHEAGHIWTSFAKRYAPELYQEGLRLAEADNVGIQRAIDRGYGHLQGNDLLEEVMAHAIGEEGANKLLMTDKQAERRNWVQRLWDKVASFVQRNIGLKLQDDFQYQTLGDFSAQIANQLLNGQKISDISNAEVREIERNTGVTRFQLVGDPKQFNNFFDTDGLPVGNNFVEKIHTGWSAQDLVDGVANALVEHGLKKHSPNVRDIDVIKAHFNDILKNIRKRADTKLGSENPMHKSFTQDLATAEEKLNNNAYMDDLDLMAKQITARQFDINDKAYSNSFRDFFNNMVKHNAQKEYLAKNGDAVFESPHTKITPATLIKEGAVTMQKVKENKEAWVGKSKVGNWIYDTQKKWFHNNVDNINSWAKSLSGSENTLLGKLAMAATTKGTGGEVIFKNNAYHYINPLMKLEWFEKGSHTNNPDLKLSELDTEEYSGVRLTTEEQFSAFMMFQRSDKVRASFFGSEEKPTRVTLKLSDAFPEERPQSTVSMGYEDYQKLLTKFDPHFEEIKDTWKAGSDNLATTVNAVYKTENGVELAPINLERDADKRWGIYYPFSVAKSEGQVYEQLKNNYFVNDIGSHRTFTPSPETVYSIESAVKTMENYVDGNAKYAAWAIPVKNIDNYLRANESNMADMGLLEQAQWWKKKKAAIFNPPEQSINGVVGGAMMGNYMLSRIGLNPFVSAEQFTAIPLAVNTIPAKYLLRARKDLFGTLSAQIKNYDMFTDWMKTDKKPVALIDEMNLHSGYALYRNTNGGSEIQRLFQGEKSHIVLDKLNAGLKKVFGKDLGITKSDLLKNIQTPDIAIGAQYWSAAKMMVEEQQGLFATDTNPAKYWSEVEKRYIRAITESQHSSDDANRSQLATNNDIISKSLSLFGSQQIAAYNGFRSRVMDYMMNDSPENLKKMCVQATNVFVTNALMTAGIKTGRLMLLGSAAALAMHKPEDAYGSYFFEGMLANVPILSPITKSVMSKYESGLYGHNISYPLLDILNDGGTAMTDAIHAIKDGTRQRQAIQSLIISASDITGLPLTPQLGLKSLVTIYVFQQGC